MTLERTPGTPGELGDLAAGDQGFASAGPHLPPGPSNPPQGRGWVNLWGSQLGTGGGALLFSE